MNSSILAFGRSLSKLIYRIHIATRNIQLTADACRGDNLRCMPFMNSCILGIPKCMSHTRVILFQRSFKALVRSIHIQLQLP